ncbi:hypothetical protein GSF70_08750 [Flavobacteriaceae bacterium W22]|nr:hypothetical protein [Flavobacteriaceae bacterium W22]
MLNQFNDLASLKLGLSINIKYAYKLCDFKPAYGIIFSDYLKNFEYWGITDIDIIFGRIREFITDEILTTYEVISVRNDYPTGSFMIFENNDKANWLFKKSKDYEKIFTSNKHFCFDECNFVHQYLEGGGDIFEIETEIESMHHVLMREMRKESLKAHFDFLIIEGLPGKLCWNNGFLSFKNEFEVLYYHLILYKCNIYSRKKHWQNIPNKFQIHKHIIIKSGIFSKLTYFWIENFSVFSKKLIIRLDAFISRKIICRKATDLESGIFNNGNQNRILNKDSENNFSLSFSEMMHSFVIFKSIFKRNIYYLDKSSMIYYKIDKNKNLIEISKDGSTFKFERI